ncbi:Predicted house-cleaning noncanonical NTP pyrophosphatase, all-alpha NTP-PPase (MazG) superfamily [Paenibacillus sp. 1_12]|uniref:nucleoside triphosphate pyrophosphohydrolase n=1 Tax=Paenibacillus sp. 1_12 TaxID=1566278 RepID=UPI0008E17656|nr:nucleoside triphosphate pyrophosphohydrolase [Paenibacillus sp. 1_12]SFK79778.1 Predicted house-cleaning noncanonical NTP pyrophosphatase, all-alpha NTP-PPase (MazG) superfamily [Paenibacillus sp. 1_12]
MKMYNKLIRDKIPQVMDAKGVAYSIRELSDREYVEKLNEKLQEELDEYIAAESIDQVEELADLVELVYAILDNKGVSVEEFEKVRLKKKEDRGAFSKKLLLLSTN